MNWAQDEVESSYLFEHFVGCLRNVQLKSGSDLSIVTPLKASAHRDIVEGCVDKFVWYFHSWHMHFLNSLGNFFFFPPLISDAKRERIDVAMAVNVWIATTALLAIASAPSMKETVVIMIVSNAYWRFSRETFSVNFEREPISNLFSHYSWSLFPITGPTTITLRGYSYISYRIYDWKDRAHSESNRISLLFRVRNSKHK
jgi:hypothetical protein